MRRRIAPYYPEAMFMPAWVVAVWWLNSFVLSNRFWHALPDRLRTRWAEEWVAASMRWRDAGRPEYDR